MLRYHNITKDDMLNGDGLRVVLWLSGCTHACEQCHNPITWDIHGGLEFDQAAKAELFDILSKDYISGITFSGGDPLHPQNREGVKALISEIKEKFPNKTIWLYTGFLYEEISNLDFMSDIDVLVDGRFVFQLFDPKLHWKGSSNQRVIDMKESLALNRIVLHNT